jgi:NAD(P)-dependent dehydrogenase (short-subunit alcohol dehydrogenase family)
VEALDRRIVAVEADVRERSQLIAALDQGIAQLGHLDIVVAQAGILTMGGRPPMQAWSDVVDVNLIGTINTIQAAMPYLQEGASIVATGSVAAFMARSIEPTPGAEPGGAGYSFTKRVLADYIHELAQQLAPRGIRANAVHPTNVNTTMLQNDVMYRTFRPDLENPTREDAELGFPSQQAMKVPYIEPVDVSNAVLFLASDEARFVTGMQLRVDAGGYLKMHGFHV